VLLRRRARHVSASVSGLDPHGASITAVSGSVVAHHHLLLVLFHAVLECCDQVVVGADGGEHAGRCGKQELLRPFGAPTDMRTPCFRPLTRTPRPTDTGPPVQLPAMPGTGELRSVVLVFDDD
jgi:hypothetical protein